VNAWIRWRDWNRELLGGYLSLFLATWLFSYPDQEGADAHARMIGALTMIDSIWSGASTRRSTGACRADAEASTDDAPMLDRIAEPSRSR
jgi:hypothetical protein